MQESKFDENSARENLKNKELAKAASREELRIRLLARSRDVLLHEFKNTHVEVWLIGSILRQNQFAKRSDIDIVIKGFSGDRFDLWTHLEAAVEHAIEIIRYEECDFQNEIRAKGLKVL